MAAPSAVQHALAARLALAEARLRSHEEVIHEIGSTIGGVHAAARVLLEHGPHISETRAASLQRLLSAELGRLDRLLTGAGEGLPEVVALDDLVAPLVAAHRLGDHEVHWAQAGIRVVAVADDLAEAVNVLLHNAVRHGKGSPIRLTTTVTPAGQAEIVVSDEGPGVPDELRDSVFERGVRDDNSSGDGLGLFIARERLADQGAALDLRDSDVGARFVITLPNLAGPHPIGPTA